MKKIRVVTKAPLEAPDVKEIEHSLANLQKEVGGLLTSVVSEKLEAKNITLFANDEGLLLGMEQNITDQYYQPIVGPILLAAHNDEGETVSLTDAQVEAALSFLKQAPKPLRPGAWLG